jgi:hypothetical protein
MRTLSLEGGREEREEWREGEERDGHSNFVKLIVATC